MIAGILQARTSSRRLPGKVLRPILGSPMLALQIERLRRSHAMELSVATSRDPSDDAIADLCEALDLRCFRGSLDDVLDRVYCASLDLGAEHVVRLTGDCPLADPALVDRVIARHLAEANDYTSNTQERRDPDGLDVEVVRFDCLEEAWREAQQPSQREHVTPFFYQHPERYQLGSVPGAHDLSAHRWVVDEPEDLEFVTRVYEALYPANPEFTSADVLALVERHPELRALNRHIATNEGWQHSLAEEQRADSSEPPR